MGAWRTVRELGLGGSLSYALLRLSASLPGVDWRDYRLIAVPRRHFPPMPRGYDWCILPVDDPRLACFGVDPATENWRRNQGMDCIAVLRDGIVQGLNWLTKAPFIEDEVPLRFHPPRGSAWDTGLMIRREARGSRAFAAVWAATGLWLDQHGLDWSLSRVADYNRPSLLAHKRMGAVEVCRIRSLKVAGLRLVTGATWAFGSASSVVDVILPAPAPGACD